MSKLYVAIEFEEIEEHGGMRIHPTLLHWQLQLEDSIKFGASSIEEFLQLPEQISEWPRTAAEIVCIIPADDVLVISCDVPGRSAGTILKALPFALEEFVAGDIESLHIAHHKIRPGQAVKCVLVNASRLEQWQSCFSLLAISPSAIVSESQLLSAPLQTCKLLFSGSEVLVTTADESAKVARSELMSFLSRMDLRSVVCVGEQLSDLELSQFAEDIKIENIDQNKFEYLITGYDSTKSINLLQGKFKVTSSPASPIKAFAGVGALLGLWLVIAMVSFAVEGYWAEYRSNILEASAFSKYKSYFPTDSSPVTLGQLNRRVKAKVGTRSLEGVSEQGFVDLISRVSDGLVSTQQLESLRFNNDKMELNFEVLLSGFQEIDPLKEQARANDVLLSVTDAGNEGTSVRARLTAEYQP